MCAWFYDILCHAFVDSLVADRNVMAAWLLHGLWFGEVGARNLVFLRVKWLQPAMKGTSCVRRVRLGSFQPVIGSSSVFCKEWLFMCAWFYSFVDSLVADRSVMAAWMLHGLYFGDEAGARNLLIFRIKWLQPAMKGTSCVRRVRLGSFQRVIGSSSMFCNEWLFMCAWFYDILCHAFVDSLVADRSVMAAWLLHGLWFGEEAGARNLLIFHVQWLQPAMKGTLCVRRVRLGSSQRVIGSSSVFCNEWLFMCAWFYDILCHAFVDSLVADRSVMAAWLLHGLWFGEEVGARNLVFFRVKWLQPAMKGTSCVRRVRLGSFQRVIGSSSVFCIRSGCSCVRDSIRLLTLWLQIAV